MNVPGTPGANTPPPWMVRFGSSVPVPPSVAPENTSILVALSVASSSGAEREVQRVALADNIADDGAAGDGHHVGILRQQDVAGDSAAVLVDHHLAVGGGDVDRRASGAGDVAGVDDGRVADEHDIAADLNAGRGADRAGVADAAAGAGSAEIGDAVERDADEPGGDRAAGAVDDRAGNAESDTDNNTVAVRRDLLRIGDAALERGHGADGDAVAAGERAGIDDAAAGAADSESADPGDFDGVKTAGPRRQQPGIVDAA